MKQLCSAIKVMVFFAVMCSIFSGCSTTSYIRLYNGNPLPRDKSALLLPVAFLEVRLYWLRNDDTKVYYIPQILTGYHEILPGNYTLGLGYVTHTLTTISTGYSITSTSTPLIIGGVEEVKFIAKPNKVYILESKVSGKEWTASIIDLEDYVPDKKEHGALAYDKQYFLEKADILFNLERKIGIYGEGYSVKVENDRVYFKK